MFDYIRENDQKDYRFFKMPHALFTEGLFDALSNEAKLLYGLLLDRMSLSAKNGWQDEKGRIFIHFKNAEVCQKLRIGAQKAVKLLRELVEIGLIERIRIGLGKPDRIYVKQYQSEPQEQENVEKAEIAMPDDDLQHSGISEIKTLEFPNAQLTPYKNKTKKFRQIPSNPSADVMEAMRAQIKNNIEYDWFAACYADHETLCGSQEELDELVELMTESACTVGTVRIHGQEMAAEVVKSRMLKIGSEHIQYVFDCLKQTTSKIRNIKAYLLTALFNAPATICIHYGAMVRHDLYGKEVTNDVF